MAFCPTLPATSMQAWEGAPFNSWAPSARGSPFVHASDKVPSVAKATVSNPLLPVTKGSFQPRVKSLVTSTTKTHADEVELADLTRDEWLLDPSRKRVEHLYLPAIKSTRLLNQRVASWHEAYKMEASDAIDAIAGDAMDAHHRYPAEECRHGYRRQRALKYPNGHVLVPSDCYDGPSGEDSLYRTQLARYAAFQSSMTLRHAGEQSRSSTDMFELLTVAAGKPLGWYQRSPFHSKSGSEKAIKALLPKVEALVQTLQAAAPDRLIFLDPNAQRQATAVSKRLFQRLAATEGVSSDMTEAQEYGLGDMSRTTADILCRGQTPIHVSGRARLAASAADQFTFTDRHFSHVQIEHYLHLARLGDGRALMQLGLLYEQGRLDLPVSPEKAAILYTHGALAGDCLCLFSLALYYHGRHKDGKDMQLAVELYRQSEVLSTSDTLINLAMLYLYGPDGIRHADLAIGYLHRALEHGNRAAPGMLGTCYEKGLGADLDFAKALAYYQQGHRNQDVDSQLNLALLYMNGLGTPFDMKAAKELVFDAADSGYGRGLVLRGMWYMKGLGDVQVNPKLAKKDFKQSCRDVPGYGYSYLAIMHHYGIGCKPNQAKCRQLLELAFDKAPSNDQGWFFLVLLDDEPMARNIFSYNAEQFDDSFAIGNLALLDFIRHTNMDLVIERLQRSIRRGPNDRHLSHACMAICYEQGFGVETDMAKALECYRRGVRIHDGPCCMLLGTLYQFGAYGVEQGMGRARELYDIAVQMFSQDVFDTVLVFTLKHILPLRKGFSVSSQASELLEPCLRTGESRELLDALREGRCFEFRQA